MTEKAFQQQVLELARLYGWLPYHTYDSRRCAPGFPDLVLVRENDRVIYAELKVPGNRLTQHQVAWRQALLSAGQDYRLWYPGDWDEIQAVLTGPRRVK